MALSRYLDVLNNSPSYSDGKTGVDSANDLGAALLHARNGKVALDMYLTPDSLAAKHLPEVVIDDNYSHDGFFKELLHSARYSLLQSPIEGMAQNFDQTIGKAFGTNFYEKSKNLLVGAPKPAKFGSSEWHAQSIGAAVGIIPWFMLTRSAVRGLAGNFAATRSLVVPSAQAATGREVLSSTGQKLILEGGVTGAAYSAAFKPVDSNDDFYVGKGKSMVKDFATFSTLTASSLYVGGKLANLAAPLTEGSVIAKVSAKAVAVGSGIGSAVPAAAAEMSADFLLSSGQKEMKAEDFFKSAYSYAVVGGALGAFHPHEAGKSEVRRVSDREPLSQSMPLNSKPDVFDFASYTNKSLAAGSMTTGGNYLKSIAGAKAFPFDFEVFDNYKVTGPSGIIGKDKALQGKMIAPSVSHYFAPPSFGKPGLAGAVEGLKLPTKLDLHEPLPLGRVPLLKALEVPSLPLAEVRAKFKQLPTAFEFRAAIGDKPVGELPEAFLSGGLSKVESFDKLDHLARALRNLDAALPPQKKTGLGARDLALAPFEIAFGDKNVSVSKIGIGEVAHVYKLSIDGRNFAFKVPNDPARLDVHGSLAETAAFVHLSKDKVSDLVEFYAANPGGKGGWMLTEYVDRPVQRAGVPLSSILAKENLKLGDDWSENRGPGNVVWDIGGIEPANFSSPKNLEELAQSVAGRPGNMIAGRKLGAFVGTSDLKEALLLCLESQNPGQVARTAAKYLADPAQKSEVFNKALNVPGAAGRVAFELDTLSDTPYITALYYKALKNPESRLEAVKMIDKLPDAERKAAFDAAFLYPEARAMAARAVDAIGDARQREEAMVKAGENPGAQFVKLQLASQKRTLSELEERERDEAFKHYFDNFALEVTGGVSGGRARVSFDDFLKNTRVQGKELISYVHEHLKEHWKDLTAEQTHLGADELESLVYNWSKLEPSQWRSLDAKDMRAQLDGMKFGALDEQSSKKLFETPDLRSWLFENNSQVSYDLRKQLLNGGWEKLPHTYKTLMPSAISEIVSAYDRAMPADWENLPAGQAQRLARAIEFLKLEPGQAKYFFASNELTDWASNHAGQFRGLDNFDFNAVLQNWHKLHSKRSIWSVDYVLDDLYRHVFPEVLQEKYGLDKNSIFYLKSLNADDEKPITIRNVVRFLEDAAAGKSEGSVEQAIDVVNNLTEGKASRSQFYMSNLQDLLRKNVFLADRPQALSRLNNLALSNDELSTIVNFIAGSRTDNARLVAHALESGMFDKVRNMGLLGSLGYIVSSSKLDEAGSRYLFSLGLSQRQAEEIGLFADSPQNRSQIKSLIDQRVGKEGLNPYILSDREHLHTMNYFLPEELAKIKALNEKGLSTIRLDCYIKDQPEHLETIKALLASGGDVDKINNVMRLSVLPDFAALKLADGAASGKYDMGELLGLMKDYRFGRMFCDLLVRHISNNGELSQVEFGKLAKRAGRESVRFNMSTETARIVDTDKVTAASALLEAADSIISTISADRPVVLLGRDAWPLVPILRARGRNAMYFLYSRRQENEPNTEKQWLREIPAGAAVIDTGYSGTIITAIRRFDPSVSGYLLSTDGPNYRKLLGDDHHSKATRIEDLPKLIYRTHRHTKKGGAVSRQSSQYSDEALPLELSQRTRWYVEQRNRELLHAVGLSKWDVWRYSTFVGLTPKERLGLSTERQVREHYERVRLSRAAK